MSSDTNEYGRFQLLLDPKADTAQLFIENVNRTGEHWLTLALPSNPYAPIGYLRLRPMKPGSPMFQVVDVRPATGPLLPANDDLIRRWFSAGQRAARTTRRRTREILKDIRHGTRG